ncbi:transglutaminase domain-containing protein [uncultured Winogradskyella sp.]|uniref:transglutaminase domain-containing protein n=1 Tax=uncultured Winogradskyella sp. TaxID=395353 RepID=UPI0026394614|nr:transglutaminase domain-containing protein [uncultured Winogradskyella sp.]
MKLSLAILLFFWFVKGFTQISDFKHIDFKKADSIALSYPNEDLTNLPELSFKLTSHLNTDVERFRAIYRWVCANIKNDYSLYLKNKHKRERFKDDSIKFKAWNTDFRKRLFNKLLKKKQTICTGYAYLVKVLADLSDLKCEIIQGYGRVSTTDTKNLTLPNHSWNAIKLNGRWYLCDPTWASGIPNPATNRFTFNYNDGFFLANPKLFAVNHFPIEQKWWLLEGENPTFDEFLNAPVIYGNAYKTLELHNTPKYMHHNLQRFQNLKLQYQLKASIDPKDIWLLIDNGFQSKKIKPTSVKLENKSLNIEHQFNRKGFFDVHLYIEEDLISTYTIKVGNN